MVRIEILGTTVRNVFIYVYLCVFSDITHMMKSRRRSWLGYLAHMGERRGAHRALVGRPEGKRPLKRPRHRWEDNIKMHL